MHIDPLEKKWAYFVLAMSGLFVTIILFDSFFHGINAPSNVETIDSARLHLTEEFAEDNLGVRTGDDGVVLIRMVAGRYGFFPKHITVPAETPLTFRWASIDVLHGMHMPMTNLSTMVVPGYVSEVHTVLPKPGEYPMLCNEYCGLGHDHMWSKVTVIAKEDWQQSTRAQQAEIEDREEADDD